MAIVGHFSLILAFLAALYGAGTAAYGSLRHRPALVESARHAMILTWPLVTVAAGCLIGLLVTGAYQVEYVANVTSRAMPIYLRVTALWGGQAGSLVFWSWLMAAFATAASLRRWERDRELLPWVIVVTMVTLAFFLSLVLIFENPFRMRIWWIWVLSAQKGLLPFISLLTITVTVSTIGTASIRSGTTGDTRLFSLCVIAIEKKAREKPRKRLPASPINSRDGLTLYLRKPITTPMRAIFRRRSSVWPFIAESTPKEMKAMRERPPASPSSPSIMLTALITPTAQKIVIGTASTPRLTGP